MQGQEIEIKVKIEKADKLNSFLKHEAKFVSQEHQIDEYFNPKHRDFLKVRPVKEWLRLRDSNGKFSLNYKYWHIEPDGTSHSSDEYESSVADLNQVRKILMQLDFQPLTVVDKSRSIWTYRDYEISLDQVVSLGHFVEIEYKGKNSAHQTPKEITTGMINFLKQLDCGTISRTYDSYPFQLLFPAEVKYAQS